MEITRLRTSVRKSKTMAARAALEQGPSKKGKTTSAPDPNRVKHAREKRMGDLLRMCTTILRQVSISPSSLFAPMTPSSWRALMMTSSCRMLMSDDATQVGVAIPQTRRRRSPQFGRLSHGTPIFKLENPKLEILHSKTLNSKTPDVGILVSKPLNSKA